MATTYVETVGDGESNILTVPFPYIRRSHVNVYVNGELQAEDWLTWISAGQVQINNKTAAELEGKRLQVRRVTPTESPEVTFTAGGLDHNDLNRANLQALYAIQEAFDRFGAVGGRSYQLDDIDSQFNNTATSFFLKFGGQGAGNLIGSTTSGFWIVSINGLVQDPRTAFQIYGGTNPRIDFTEAPRTGDNCTIVYLKLLDGGAGAGSGGGDPGGGDPGGGTGGGGAAPIHVGPLPPDDPVEGQVWFDTAELVIKIYENGVWVSYTWFPVIPPTNIVVGGSAPTDPVEGMIWFDQVAGLIKIYENGQWVEYEWKPLIAPAGVSVGSSLPAVAADGEVFFNTTDNQIYFREEGAWIAYSWGVTGQAEVLTVIDEANLPGGASIGQLAYVTSQDKLYIRGSTGWTSDFASADLGPGSITSSMIAANAITADKLAANSVTAVKIAANTITGNKIAADTIAAIHLAADSVTANKIAAGAITGNKIAAATITGDRIVGFSIGAAQLAANSITAEKIAAGSIEGTKIAAATITGDKLAINSITANRIQTNTLILGTTNLEANAISQVQWAKGGFVGVGTSMTTVLSLTMSCTPGAKRIVDVNYTHADDYFGSINPGVVPFGSVSDIVINGASVTESDMTVQGASTNGHSFRYVDEASRSGSVTFQVRVRHFSSGSKSGTTVRNPVLVVTELKR